MNKRYLDDFYKRVQENKEYDIFTLSLPMFLITKNLQINSDSFYKSKYDERISDNIFIIETIFIK